MKRQMVTIDEEKCDGCELCIPNCPEGALQIIDGKARLVSDLFCDGLGACIGHCPQGAITIEEREAGPYDERRVMANVAEQGTNVIKAHLEHLHEHGQTEYLKEAIQYMIDKDLDVPEEFRAGSDRDDVMGAKGGATGHNVPEVKTAESGHAGAAVSGCPGCQVIDMDDGEEQRLPGGPAVPLASTLRQWPVQITLVPPFAPYLQNADLLIAADCVPFAYAGFHNDLLKGKVLLVGCPKLDDATAYIEKLSQVFLQNDIKSLTIAHMEVPCCFGFERIVKAALQASGKNIPIEDINISIKGERLN